MLGEWWGEAGRNGQGRGAPGRDGGSLGAGQHHRCRAVGLGGEHREQRGLPEMGPDTEGLRHSSDAITCGMAGSQSLQPHRHPRFVVHPGL